MVPGDIFSMCLGCVIPYSEKFPLLQKWVLLWKDTEQGTAFPIEAVFCLSKILQLYRSKRGSINQGEKK